MFGSSPAVFKNPLACTVACESYTLETNEPHCVYRMICPITGNILFRPGQKSDAKEAERFGYFPYEYRIQLDGHVIRNNKEE